MADQSPLDLVTLDEFAKMLKVPLSTVRYWRAQGRGPRFGRVGKYLMARRSDVEAWVDAQLESAS